MTKKNLLNYIYNSPLFYENESVDFDNMSENQLLEFVGGVIDAKPNEGEHSYEIIPAGSFHMAKQYEHYAPTWCIFQSEDVFFEETHQGTCHFVFCKRDDADEYRQIAFG